MLNNRVNQRIPLISDSLVLIIGCSGLPFRIFILNDSVNYLKRKRRICIRFMSIEGHIMRKHIKAFKTVEHQKILGFHRRRRSSVSGLILRFGIVRLDSRFPDSLIETDPSLLEILVEVRILTRKLSALKTKINIFLLTAAPDSAGPEKPAIFFPASLAVLGRKIIEHQFEIAVFFEDGVIKKTDESFGIHIEVSQLFFEF